MSQRGQVLERRVCHGRRRRRRRTRRRRREGGRVNIGSSLMRNNPSALKGREVDR